MKITCSMCTAKRMIPCGSRSTQFKSFLIVLTKTGKKSLKINSNVIPRRPGMTFEQRERAISMLTAGMLARDVARHFQCHESTISRLLNIFQQTGDAADRPRSGRPRKTTSREDRFLTTSCRRNRFLSSGKFGRLLRNATGTRVCDRTVRNRLHAARLKVCHHYVGIPLM